ncbi:TlpA family protein disulfide reductase [Clostridium sp. DL1XJH146]
MKKTIIGLIIGIVIIGGLLYVKLVDSPDDFLKSITGNGDTNTEQVDEDVNADDENFALEVGKESPDFTLTDLEGNDVSLSDYKGKYVLINFWATWCHFCVEEMPDLEKFNNENEDIVVLAVNVKESHAEAEKFVNDGGYTFTTLLDDKGTVSNDYLVAAFPTSYFIDKEGLFLGRVQGMMTYEQMNGILAQIKE